MFKFESEMISVLIDHLPKVFNTTYFVDEFDSGNGVADLVFTSELEEESLLSIDYEMFFLMYKHFNRVNKRINLKQLSKQSFMTKKKVDKLIHRLLDSGILELVDDHFVYVRKRYTPPVKKIISIEAKLSDWKGGMCQAMRYKTYSHKSFLAISKEYSHRVDRNMLRENNVGLITVSPEEVSVEINVKSDTPKNRVVFSHLSEQIANRITSDKFAIQQRQTV